MSFQAPMTISEALSRIRERRLLLPAIQREFVWEAWQVEWLFDSLLQGYPIGSFLFWEVRDNQSKNQFQYYEFLRTYRERFSIHNPPFATAGHYDFDAVLDGQQRLTALQIGLIGTYAYKLPRTWWEDNEHALPTRRLFLNTRQRAKELDDEQSGRIYDFQFLTEQEYTDQRDQWFLVGDILKVSDAFAFNQMLKERGYLDNEFASRALANLHSVVHLNRIINYYSVQQADMERALNVFVRVNSGGTKLSLSDMLLSTAIANWKRNARKEILGLVDQIQGKGFFVDKDLVLKACLYLYSSDIRYKVSNFSAAQVKPFEDNWDAIASSILAVFQLIHDFGFNEKSLTSKNAVLPLIYWVHHKGIAADVANKVAFRADRESMMRWLHTMLLKGVFGSSADTVLAAIRKAFTAETFGDPFMRPEITQFPSQAIGTILQSQGKDPNITDEFLDALLDTRYEEKQAFSILALLAPNLDYRNGDFHKDHLHPASKFRTRRGLQNIGVSDDNLDFYRDEHNWNSILNLRHLDSNENKSKQDTALDAWVQSESARQKTTVEKFCVDRDLPPSPPLLAFGNFRDFIESRRKLLHARLREALA
jgi:uncharacterized protein with ParB-like and HNH nuclease domain